jgi:hypothetical protein
MKRLLSTVALSIGCVIAIFMLVVALTKRYHFFLEIDGGGVLHLCSQDYDSLWDWRAEEQPGEPPYAFPGDMATVFRRNFDGHMVDVTISGNRIPFDDLPDSYWDPRASNMPSDGEVISDRTFEELRHRTHPPRS